MVPKALPAIVGEGVRSLALAPGMFECSDLGNAERFVARHRAEVRYNPQRKHWLVWDGTRWVWDERGKVLELAKSTVRSIHAEAAACKDDKLRLEIAAHARSSEKVGRIQAMLSLAKSAPPLPVLISELDVDPYLLNCKNGTLDLRTGQLRQHSRDDLITKTTGVNYDPAARSELWERVLADATGGDLELAEYLQRVIGYALIGESLERAFFFLYGPPGTLKSTLVLAFMGALGDYASSAAFDTWLVQSATGGNRGDLVRLAGARLVVSVEVRQGARFDEALLKAVTGGDEITAAAKYEGEVSFIPSFSILLAANDAPTARDDDAGLWVRLRRIPLTAQIPADRQDPQIKIRLRDAENAAAVLAWAVEGSLAYQRQGLGTCSAVEISTRDYRNDMDRVAGFLSDRCVFGLKSRVKPSELRDAYTSWCHEQGIKPLTGKEFSARLEAAGCEPTKTNGIRYWRGIGLAEPT